MDTNSGMIKIDCLDYESNYNIVERVVIICSNYWSISLEVACQTRMSRRKNS